MATPMTKSGLSWVNRTPDQNSARNPNTRRSRRYYSALFQAWPDWCAGDPQFREIYAEAERRRNVGENVQVDHIVPICSDLVCGLHVPWNLRIIEAGPNMSKGNRFWPDAPFENLDLFAASPSPFQRSLGL